jgi:ATP/maltotriose-dependent transcriptional regulator MalT
VAGCLCWAPSCTCRRRVVSSSGASRLVDQLVGDPTSAPRLVLVSAPAGFGKTTLLTQWLASGRVDAPGDVTDRSCRAVWLSLDVYAGTTVVALDDYHVIDTPAVHEAVTFLLDHLPPRVTLAMTTRADPPLPPAPRGSRTARPGGLPGGGRAAAHRGARLATSPDPADGSARAGAVERARGRGAPGCWRWT